jgi:NIPSNAP
VERRRFLTSTLAASAISLAPSAFAQAPSSKPREYYELRKYHLQTGPQTKLMDGYLADSLIPALNRMGMSPIGAFHLDIGSETPIYYLLIPSNSLETLATSELRLAKDEVFMKSAEAFWNAPATSPAYLRVESSLLIAFEGWPKLTPPAKTEHRIFQLRTYESPSNQDHVRKVEMFHNGEFDIFQKAGFAQVFYGDALIGGRLPNLTYMLSFPDMNAMNERWEIFRNDPNWKKLSTNPRYSYESIVTNISNLTLSPAPYSQI